VLYNTSIVSLYVDIDTQMVEDIFQAANCIIQSTPFPGSSNLANSPVMMAGPRLFLTIFKLSQLCRRAPLWPEDRSEVDEVARELHAAIISLEDVLRPDADDTAREELLAPKLYALAASIMLYKLQNPAASASDPEVQVKVRKAMEILPAVPSPFAPSQYLCWPIYIVGCAVVSWPDKVFILWMLQTLSVCGDLKRAAIALQANWNAAEGEHSGLDMLLHKRSALYQ
jgi:Fungal specific transcription factor domain